MKHILSEVLKVVGKMDFNFCRLEMFPAVSSWKALWRNSTNLVVSCTPPTLQRVWRYNSRFAATLRVRHPLPNYPPMLIPCLVLCQDDRQPKEDKHFGYILSGFHSKLCQGQRCLSILRLFTFFFSGVCFCFFCLGGGSRRTKFGVSKGS